MKISVIIPCYNQGAFLKETCKSLVNQTYTNWEAIIVNDGSTDNTQTVAHEICSNDRRFFYYYKENGGSASARNEGLKHITGDFIQFLDADDYLLDTKFEVSIKNLNQYDIIITNFLMFHDSIKNTTPPFCDLSIINFKFENILIKWDVTFAIPQHSCIIKKSSFKNLHFNEELKSKEDWVFFVDLFKQNPKVKFINKNLALYRQHNSNKSKNQDYHKNTIPTFKHILNQLSGTNYFQLFLNRIIKNLTEERVKSEFLYKLKKDFSNKLTIEQEKSKYLFNLKNKNEKKINQLEELYINKNKELDLEHKKSKYLFDLKNEHEEKIQDLQYSLTKIKKTVAYKTLVKLELFLRQKH